MSARDNSRAIARNDFFLKSSNKNKIVYKGDFINGLKTGSGKFEFDGNLYEGDFVDGQFHGKGKYYFNETGKIYEGDFHENKIHGSGLMLWTDGTKY